MSMLFVNQLILVGVCCSGSSDGTDPYAEVSLQPLPEYTIPSDGVTMTCITCTDRGHIFLAGRDGHVYELQYTTGSGWQKRCRKVCLTAGLGSVISRCSFSSLCLVQSLYLLAAVVIVMTEFFLHNLCYYFLVIYLTGQMLCIFHFYWKLSEICIIYV